MFALLFGRYPGWIIAVVIIPLYLAGACMGFLNAYLRYRGRIQASNVWLHSPLAAILASIACIAFAIELGLRIYSSDSQWAMPIFMFPMLIVLAVALTNRRGQDRE